MTRTILHYNWAQPDDPHQRGGGVSVYLKNMVTAALAHRDDVNFILVNAGQHYGFFRRGLRLQAQKTTFDPKRVKAITILNSPIKAPAHDMFYAIRDWRTDTKIARKFAAILRRNPEIDEVVFHSLEGISSEVLALQTQFPAIKFIYMWHNYMPLCPQIELLNRFNRDCTDFKDGLNCLGCLGGMHNHRDLIRMQRVGSALERSGLAGRPQGNFLFTMAQALGTLMRGLRFGFADLRHGLRHGFKGWRRAKLGRGGFDAVNVADKGPGPRGDKNPVWPQGATDYKAWRQTNVAILNGFAENRVVSDLVAKTIIGLGIDASKVRVTPLAMDLHATPKQMKARAKPAHDIVTLSFMGYFIPSKGLPFMLEALLNNPAKILKTKARLVVYARMNDHARRILAPLQDCFHEVEFVDGYARSDLAKIAREVDLNIVPSIWRETFNQVGYELMCLGTPSLVSDFVGLSMFYKDNPDFVFRANDPKDFQKKLVAFVEDPGRIPKFFDAAPELPPMSAHLSSIGL